MAKKTTSQSDAGLLYYPLNAVLRTGDKIELPSEAVRGRVLHLVTIAGPPPQLAVADDRGDVTTLLVTVRASAHIVGVMSMAAQEGARVVAPPRGEA